MVKWMYEKYLVSSNTDGVRRTERRKVEFVSEVWEILF